MLFLATALLLTPDQTHDVAMRIWKNECGLKVENLVTWNVGEEFPSLGIGHFIWYPEGKRGPFLEMFPQYIQHCKEKGCQLPAILEKNNTCPWKSRDEFLKIKDSSEIATLRQFLLDTIDLQAEVITMRLYRSLDKIKTAVPDEKKEEIAAKFTLIAKAPAGLYVLIDYINFKGEGIVGTERYNGKGWGLLQVLQCMSLQNAKNDPLKEFRTAAKTVLSERVANSPPERNESRWLAGWLNRIDTYQ